MYLICMSESNSLFGDYHEMADIWARIQAFDQLLKHDSHSSNL